MRLLDIRLLGLMVTSSNQQSENRRDEEEDTVHDSKRKCGFQHGAVLVGVEIESVQAKIACTSIDVDDAASARDVGTVPASGIAQGVDGTDEGADEEEIHECDKV